METKAQGISVIMPAYNASRTLARAIESVLAQTYENLELIVIDDCSKDDSYAIAQRYAQQDKRVRVVKNEKNAGVSDTRNRGVQLAQYEWIALLDSDDYWLKDKLELQLDKISCYPESSICFTASQYIDEEGNRSEYILHVPEKVSFDELLHQNIISCSSVLVKKEMLMRFPMHRDPMVHEDYITWLRILQLDPYAIGVDQPLLVYQISAGSKSGNKVKAARMQWRSYRQVSLPMMKRCVCFAQYMMRNLKKYRNISKQM